MEKKQSKFDEQAAPEKNTDNAFVQVRKDGSPAIPNTQKNTAEGKAIGEQQGKQEAQERD